VPARTRSWLTAPRRLLNKRVWGRGASSALWRVVEVRPGVDTRVTPPLSSVALQVVGSKALARRSGQGPGGAGVAEAQGDQSA
jgi:hypothetical protein